MESNVYRCLDFPMRLDLTNCQNFAKFVGEQIGRDANVGTLEDNRTWPIAFIFKKYDEGTAYSQMSFIKRNGPFVGVQLSAKVPFREMQDLVTKLHDDVENSYKEFFK